MRAKFFDLKALGAVGFGLLVAMLSSAARAQTLRLELSVEPGSSEVGIVAKIPVRFNSPVGIGAAQFELVFDPAMLKFKGIENGSQLPAGLVESNEVQPGHVRVALVSNEEVKGAGVLLLAEFEMTSGPQASTSVNLESARGWDLANNLPVVVGVKAGEWKRTSVATTVTERSLWIYGLGGLAVVAAASLLAVALRFRKSRG